MLRLTDKWGSRKVAGVVRATKMCETGIQINRILRATPTTYYSWWMGALFLSLVKDISWTLEAKAAERRP